MFVGSIISSVGSEDLNMVPCKGQPLVNNMYPTLSKSIGATFFDSFPNLQGVTPVGYGEDGVGTSYGSEWVNLNLRHLPTHIHDFVTSNDYAE